MKSFDIKAHYWLIGCIILIVLSGCAATSPLLHFDGARLPPILSQSEVIGGYEKLGRIQITREVYISDGLATSDMREWGFAAIRREAYKMGADAVIFPEVSGTHSTSILLPSVEYRATGIAIKFK